MILWPAARCRTTLRELRIWAQKGYLIQWHPSGIYEKLELGEEGKLFAEGPVTRRHEIHLPARGFFRCRPVNPSERVCAGDLLFPRYVPCSLRRRPRVLESHFPLGVE